MLKRGKIKETIKNQIVMSFTSDLTLFVRTLMQVFII